MPLTLEEYELAETLYAAGHEWRTAATLAVSALEAEAAEQE